MLSQTKMTIPKFFTNPKNKKNIWIIFIVLIVIASYVLGQIFSGVRQQNVLTIPIIPATITTMKEPPAPLDTTNPFNPEQKLIFNWGEVTANLPATITDYSSSLSLVNPNTITTVANKLGFTTLERSPYSDEKISLWNNDHASLFGSPEQNQILFNSTTELAEHSGTISKEEAILLARSVTSGLFGESLLVTFDPNPEVKHLLLVSNTEDEPAETTPEKANLINVNFQQLIDKLPLITLSKKGETISVAMDTAKKIHLLYIYGGYQGLKAKGSISVPGISQLIETAPTKAMRISYSKDIPSESVFTDAKVINIKVESVEIGYFQRNDQTIFPVFIVKGIMSARGVDSFPATYIIPISSI